MNSRSHKKARALIFGGALVFGLSVWPTVYCPLGEDTAGNPMRENRFTGAEEVMPFGSGEWMDATAFRENAAKASQGNKMEKDLIATVEPGQTSFR